jgi:hypothetical protein
MDVLPLDELRALRTALGDLGFIEKFRVTKGGANVDEIRALLRERGWQPPTGGAF